MQSLGNLLRKNGIRDRVISPLSAPLCHCDEWEKKRDRKYFFDLGGQRNALKTLDSAKGIQGNPSLFL
jgi:hypothetical protein